MVFRVRANCAVAIAQDNTPDLLIIVGKVRQPSTLAVLESWEQHPELLNEEAGTKALARPKNTKHSASNK